MITVCYRRLGWWHAQDSSDQGGGKCSLGGMSADTESTAPQPAVDANGSAPAPLGEAESITPPERIMGVVGMFFGVVILVLGFDLLTGIPSRILASWGSDDAA